MTRMIKIFEGELEANSTKTFEYFPQRKDKKCVGVLITSGVQVSLFFDSGNEMAFQGLPASSNSSLSPDSRIISVERKVPNYLKGKISNKKNVTCFSSIYLIIS